MIRRDFLKCAAASALVGCSGTDEFETYVDKLMASNHIPGVAGCLVQNGEVVRELSYGYADIVNQTPMGLDTLQNIGSISKTFTATAVMQLWEQRAFALDDDVNKILPFTVHPDAPVSIRQLLTHTSSISDGVSYARNYVCGDHEVSLGTWLEDYFTPGGRFYNAGETYHPWRPGERYAYNNVAFGLLAHIVEFVSDESFEDYCQRHIFQPLGMTESSWYLANIEISRHATPYTWFEGGEARAPTWGGESLGVIGGETGTTGYVANCLYNHPNYPDGFLRTSVRQLALYLNAYLRNGDPILKPETVDTMLRVHANEIWGLCWFMRSINGRTFWGHDGADPGVNTIMDFNPGENVGAIIFSNTYIDDDATDIRALNTRLISTML